MSDRQSVRNAISHPHSTPSHRPRGQVRLAVIVVVLIACIPPSIAGDKCRFACTEVTGLPSPQDQAYELGIRTSGGTCVNVTTQCETQFAGNIVAKYNLSVQTGTASVARLNIKSTSSKPGAHAGEWTFEIDDVGNMFVGDRPWRPAFHAARYGKNSGTLSSGQTMELTYPNTHHNYGRIGGGYASHGFFFLPVRGLYDIVVSTCCGDVSANSNVQTAKIVHVLKGIPHPSRLAQTWNDNAVSTSGSTTIYSEAAASLYVSLEWVANNGALWTAGGDEMCYVSLRLVEDMTKPINLDTLPRSCAGMGTLASLLIDPDGINGPIQPHWVTCENGWTTVANLIDSPGDDFPQTDPHLYLRAGYHTPEPGTWKVNNDTSLGYYPHTTAQSFTGVMGIDVIEQYLDAGVFTHFKWCWVGRTGVSTAAPCRDTESGHFTLPIYSSLDSATRDAMDPTLLAWFQKHPLLYMYARVIGWNLRKNCVYYGGAVDTGEPYNGCPTLHSIFFTSGPYTTHTGHENDPEAAWGHHSGGQTTSWDGHDSGNGNYGAWHIYGWGPSFAPTGTGDNEIRNEIQDEIYLLDGFRISFK